MLKDTPHLANVSFGLSALQGRLMGVSECCFPFAAIPAGAAAMERAQSDAVLQARVHGGNMHVQNRQRRTWIWVF